MDPPRAALPVCRGADDGCSNTNRSGFGVRTPKTSRPRSRCMVRGVPGRGLLLPRFLPRTATPPAEAFQALGIQLVGPFEVLAARSFTGGMRPAFPGPASQEGGAVAVSTVG